MKPYSQAELRTFVATVLEPLVGSQLQDVLASDRGLALGFWRSGTRWLILDLLPNSPLAFVFGTDETNPWRKGDKPKPAALFLRSHGKNKILRSVSVREETGRVIVMQLSNQDGECEIEVQLIPKQPNLIVRADKKQIAWEKPRELLAPVDVPSTEERDLAVVRTGWLNELRTGSAAPSADPGEQWRRKRDRDLEKKQKALGEIETLLARDDAKTWYDRGDAMKAGGELIDAREDLAWNLNEAYGRAKKAAAKREGTENRRALLTEEIARLGSETFESSRKAAAKAPPAGKDLFTAADAQGRKLVLADGVTAFLGRSAGDNLALLRKAKAWDYWLHLRDYPGAHAIIHRQRDQLVADEDLRKVARWVAKESSAAKGLSATRVAVALAECRHVRPIKGDRLGRVTYHEARHLVVDLG